jgi:4-hydroxyphenylpyruvate dioxygenase
VEIFEPDLIASPGRPPELAARCADLGLSIHLYWRFRDLGSTDRGRLGRNLHRAERLKLRRQASAEATQLSRADEGT